MKASKSAQKVSAREECGVWLDAAQLKEKAKRKGVTRLISKMLSPFPGGGRYRLAGVLNFTQTKMQMPKTKQSSISTFFTPQRKGVHNKMSTSEAPNVNPALPSSSFASAAPTPEPRGTKRKREIDLDGLYSEPGAAREEKSIPEEVWQDQAESRTRSQDKHCDFEEDHFEEVNPPQTKRRSAGTSLSDDSQPLPQAWSQDPLFTYSQYSDDEFCQSDLKIQGKDLSDSELSYFNSLKSERDFIDCVGVGVETSTQKSSRHSHPSHVDVHKERSGAFSSQSGPFSNQKWTEPKSALPQKLIPVHLRKNSDKGDSLDPQFNWTKPSSPPLKKPHQSCRAVDEDEDSLAMLFTQDSEGCRVMAHRGVRTRRPLRDQSNINTRTARTVPHKTVAEDDEEDEMLFTQDSQGNLVIKH
ncbi:aurora kinase A- and ninein-interacting protein [Brachionichthys hirsutus]|uniref:aurora kinase A- and ninein-interacting protein n=1 Tax=Brachionichthys hirsutus TaxID=412623 RepID=UPI0036053813